ncbi:hypothetical protein BGZ72_008916 [Mortierella alpina]|nr:hypothetical protein BGZ72_008916 [Mortierella alpina]
MSLRGRQLFVGNDLFRGAGVVQRANVMLGRDGRSKGHGIVLFATIEDATKAQEMFNAYEWHGRPLEVREDRSIVDYVPRKPDHAHQEDVNELTESLEKNLSVKPNSDTHEHDQLNTDEKDGALKDEVSGTEALKPVQGRTIHVGNIPFRVRWQDLKDLFRKAGHVVRADVAMGPDNRSRGFGTVIFMHEDEAKKAIAMFDQYQWQDRVIQVQEERTGQENGRHQDGMSHGAGPGPYHSGPYHLPFQCQWQDLKDLFRRAGNIVRADVAHGFDGRSRGFGSVLFGTPEEARIAITTFDNYEYNGRVLRVHYDRFTPMSHGPPMHGNMGPMLHPHPSHHPHPHAHHQPHHPVHRMHPMHAQHGFHGNFHQPQMMPLGSHPMGGPFNMGPPPFGGSGFSPTLLGPGSNQTEFSTGDGSADGSPNPSDLQGVATNSGISSPPQFESTSATSVGLVPLNAVSVGMAPAAFPSSVGLHPGSAAQQYPFLPHLGPIGKPALPHSHLNEHHSGIGSGLLSDTADGLADADSDGVFVPLNGGNPYQFGSSGTNGGISLEDGSATRDFGHDGDQDEGSRDGAINSHSSAFSPGFYMYPGFGQNQQQHQHQQQQHHQQNLFQQHHQVPPPPGYGHYQDQQQHHLGHPRANVLGSMGEGNSSLGHGYPNQPEWIAHPNSFMMGPPQHMYGSLPFGQYEHHRGLGGEEEEENETGVADEHHIQDQHSHHHHQLPKTQQKQQGEGKEGDFLEK